MGAGGDRRSVLQPQKVHRRRTSGAENGRRQRAGLAHLRRGNEVEITKPAGQKGDGLVVGLARTRC